MTSRTIPSSGFSTSESQLLAAAVLEIVTLHARDRGTQDSDKGMRWLQMGWSQNRLKALIGPDIDLLRRIDRIRTTIVIYHGYGRLRGIAVEVADFDGLPVRPIEGQDAIEVDRRAALDGDEEVLRLAMLEAMGTVATDRLRRKMAAARKIEPTTSDQSAAQGERSA